MTYTWRTLPYVTGNGKWKMCVREQWGAANRVRVPNDDNVKVARGADEKEHRKRRHNAAYRQKGQLAVVLFFTVSYALDRRARSLSCRFSLQGQLQLQACPGRGFHDSFNFRPVHPGCKHAGTTGTSAAGPHSNKRLIDGIEPLPAVAAHPLLFIRSLDVERVDDVLGAEQ
jgi:hypothetical protein